MGNDTLISFLVNQLKTEPFVRRVILFGSHARKEASMSSDYDFAFEVDINSPDLEVNWSKFCTFLREQNPTLNTIDLVRLDLIAPSFKERIYKEGKVIYEQKT